MRRLSAVLVLALAAPVAAQPTALVPDVTVERLATLVGGTVRIAYEPASESLYTLTLVGDVTRYTPPYAGGTVVASGADTGIDGLTQGLAVGPGGTLYVTGNELTDTEETGVVARGTPDGAGGYVWTRMAQTETFLRAGNSVDHKMNAVVVAPDGSLVVNHGSRTDHGEVQANDGAAPGVREIPITSALLRVPAGATGLVLPNDADALVAGGYLVADGLRNAFDLAYDADGRLYAAENGGDRDDSDELNWIRPGFHYGFPWRIGTNDTPQRFPGYDPDADPLLNPLAGRFDFFYDDPGYPAPPDGVTFTDPVANVGPDADRFRDAAGAIRDASDDGGAIGTFTTHRSPLGLTFDAARSLPAPFTADGFVLSYTNGVPGTQGASPLLTPFGDPSQDLLHLDFSDPETLSARRIVGGFEGPVDAELVGRTMYVVEVGASNGLWAVRFTGTVAAEPDVQAVASVRVAPSPFRGSARVELQVRRAAVVRVHLVDALGRRVATLHDGPLPAGPRTFAVDGARLPAGTYHVRVTGDGTTVSRPLVRVR